MEIFAQYRRIPLQTPWMPSRNHWAHPLKINSRNNSSNSNNSTPRITQPHCQREDDVIRIARDHIPAEIVHGSIIHLEWVLVVIRWAKRGTVWCPPTFWADHHRRRSLDTEGASGHILHLIQAQDSRRVSSTTGQPREQSSKYEPKHELTEKSSRWVWRSSFNVTPPRTLNAKFLVSNWNWIYIYYLFIMQLVERCQNVKKKNYDFISRVTRTKQGCIRMYIDKYYYYIYSYYFLFFLFLSFIHVW